MTSSGGPGTAERSRRRGAAALGLAALLLAAGCTTANPDGPRSAVTAGTPTSGPTGPAPANDSPTAGTPPVPTAPTTAPITASITVPTTEPTTEPTTAPTNQPPPVTLRTVSLAPGVNDEASGVALSTTAPGLMFLVDDGTGTGGLAVVDEQGTLVTRVELAGMSAANAEALTAGPCGTAVPRPDGGAGGSCLYVGDIGDNAQRRPDIAVYRAAEPDLSAGATGGLLADPITVAADQWRYAYPDRPQNAESMMIAPDGSIIVVTKPRNGAAHRMYRGMPGGGTLAFVREFAVPGSPLPMRTILTGNVATDLATTPGRVLLLTYDDVHEYTAPDPAADPSGFPDWPTRSLPMPRLPQAEGIAGASDGCGYVVASEAGPGGDAGSLGIATCR